MAAKDTLRGLGPALIEHQKQAPREGRSRLARIGKALALSLAALALSLAVLEVGLRLAGYGNRASMYYDPLIGSRFHPNQVRSKGIAGNIVLPEFTIGEYGYRTPSFSGKTHAGIPRIACVGDSFTFGWAVEDAQSYPAVLLEKLNAGPQPVEVMNFGIPGYNTENELLTYRHVIREFAPDTIVIGFFLNDVAPREAGEKHTSGLLFSMLGKTAMLEFFQQRLQRRFSWFQARRKPAERERWRQYKKDFLRIQHEPATPVAKPYWDRCMEDLSTLIAEISADGAEPVVVFFPSVTQHRAYDPNTEKTAELRPQDRVGECAAASGARFLDLTDTFMTAPTDPFGDRDPSHPSVFGYALAAEAIAAFL